MTLPVGWASASIGELCNLINGKAFKPTDWSVEGLPIIRIQNLNRDDSAYNFFNSVVEEKFIVEPGELLFAWSGTPGTSFGAHVWRGPRAVLNQHIFRVLFDRADINRDYFKLAINSTLHELISKAHGGVGLAHVTKGKFEATKILIPPSQEQSRIVAKLEALITRLAHVRSELNQILSKISMLRSTIINQVFSPINFKRWHRQTFADVIDDGLIGLVRSKEEQSSSGFPYIRMNHFDLNGVWNEEGLTHVNCSPTEFRRYQLRANDLLFNTRNSFELVGKVGLWPENHDGFVYNNNILRIRLYSTMDPLFVHAYMQSKYFRTLMDHEKSATTSVAAIYQRSLYRSPIPVPPLDEQREIAEHIRETSRLSDRLESEAARARALLDRLEAALLARAFRGKLVPQDPADEPANVLLDRIRARRAAAPRLARGRLPAVAEA